MASAKEYIERARKLRAAIEKARDVVAIKGDDDEIVECADLFPKWKADRTYEKNSIVRKDGMLCRVSKTHRSKPDQPPGKEETGSAYKVIPRKKEV